jgi:hypothetical protein
MSGYEPIVAKVMRKLAKQLSRPAFAPSGAVSERVTGGAA